MGIHRLAGQKPRYDGRRVTFEEWLALPDDGYSYEMIAGVLRLNPPVSTGHGSAHPMFAHIIMRYFDTFEVPPGKVFTDTFLKLPYEHEDTLGPDVCVIKTENLHIAQGTRIEGTPDLVAEVVSPSNARRDLVFKRERYLQGGVPEYWTADPHKHVLIVRYAVADDRGKRAWEEIRGDVLESRVFPGLKISAAKLFG